MKKLKSTDKKNILLDHDADALRTQIEEYKQQNLRVLADYRNLEKRTTLELADSRRTATGNCIVKLLPVLDNLYRAYDHLKDPGIELSIRQFRDVLKSLGVKKIEALGHKFDPHLMECVETTGDGAEIVTAEIEAGYTYDNRVLRVAKVKVGQNAPTDL
ncbi:nucleotide exchange factor GrpE [Candidatus Gottesmanbacteria bacterium RBG_16_43_7]|uniref:Protein GrpE n=1 Tax=Candidatus Gottesmanbacteria bacterium RBG_16_43_7 TaxID=1798373 RepID=A0A1F5Z972_9BACT|nr:MAG: nucleotide exchange factor GrpE [Candidatus Gottesmanbacteria bacterium RBG_16_43_7]